MTPFADRSVEGQHGECGGCSTGASCNPEAARRRGSRRGERWASRLRSDVLGARIYTSTSCSTCGGIHWNLGSGTDGEHVELSRVEKNCPSELPGPQPHAPLPSGCQDFIDAVAQNGPGMLGIQPYHCTAQSVGGSVRGPPEFQIDYGLPLHKNGRQYRAADKSRQNSVNPSQRERSVIATPMNGHLL